MDHLPRIDENVPLAGLTTLRVGGPARYYARPASVDELTAAVAWAEARALPVLVLGGGSNLLVADKGFGGLVAHLALGGVTYDADATGTIVTAGAGVVWDELVAECVARKLGGIECLSGIPGLVGATPIQNVGAYGQEVSETIVRVDALDLQTLDRITFATADCAFGYRTSRFKTVDRGRYVVTRVAFRLTPDAVPAIRYRDLEAYFDQTGKVEPTLDAARCAVLEIRRRKAMVLDDADTDTWSAGSFFVNPVVDEGFAAGLPAAAPRFPASGGVKLSAAWLIEHAGFSRGHQKGRVGLSSRHALAIVNRGGASAIEIAALARDIREAVRLRFGVTLVPEPVCVGLTI